MIFSASRFGPKLWGALQIHGGLFILIIIILANAGIMHKIKEVETNKYVNCYYYLPLVAIFLTLMLVLDYLIYFSDFSSSCISNRMQIGSFHRIWFTPCKHRVSYLCCSLCLDAGVSSAVRP